MKIKVVEVCAAVAVGGSNRPLLGQFPFQPVGTRPIGSILPTESIRAVDCACGVTTFRKDTEGLLLGAFGRRFGRVAGIYHPSSPVAFAGFDEDQFPLILQGIEADGLVAGIGL